MIYDRIGRAEKEQKIKLRERVHRGAYAEKYQNGRADPSRDFHIRSMRNFLRFMRRKVRSQNIFEQKFVESDLFDKIVGTERDVIEFRVIENVRL